jgi:hypothetical protein
MATKKALTVEVYEGHGDGSTAPSVRKGTFQQVGSVVPLAARAISPNVKNSTSSGGEQ